MVKAQGPHPSLERPICAFLGAPWTLDRGRKCHMSLRCGGVRTEVRLAIVTFSYVAGASERGVLIRMFY